MTAEDVLDALGLLSEWQSLHALLPPHLRAMTDDLNRETLAVLNAQIDGSGEEVSQ